MKFFFFPVLFLSVYAFAQTPEEQWFLDSMKARSNNFIGKKMMKFNILSKTGENYTQKNLTGKITFFNFWFEACAPCIAEMKALQALYEKYRDSRGFRFVSVTFENSVTIARVREKYKITYPVFTTSMDTCYLLNQGSGFPTTLITDKKGKIAFFTFGGGTDQEREKQKFETYLYPIVRLLLRQRLP